MKFETKKYTSFKTFLEDATTLLKKNVFIEGGGVQGLYTANGTKVNSLLQLQDNGVYVATKHNEVFKDGYYNRKVAPLSSPRTAPFTSRDSIYSSCSKKSQAKPCMQAGDTLVAKKITIVRAGNRPRKVSRVLLNSRNAHDFEAVMTVINEAVKFDSAPIHSLYTLGGNLVCDLSEIFGRHFIFFAFRKESICLVKDFQLSKEEVQAVLQLNKPPSSDKTCLKKPPPKEVESTKVLPQISCKYDLSKRIGTGRYCSIHICSVKTINERGMKYAMKIAHKNKATYKSLNQELLMLKEIRHPNIVRLTHQVDSASEVYFVFELLDKDLKTLLNDEGKIPEDEAKLIMTGILSALFYLHCLKIVHRGVSTSNVMVKAMPSGVRTTKLIDFGSACRAFEPMFDICGETAFMAPEMLKLQGYDEKVDVWAAGVVLFYMLSLTAPFLGNTEEEDKRLIVEERFETSSDAWANILGNAKHIICRMLCKNPTKRYSADALLSHSWITGVSIDEFGNFEESKSLGGAHSTSSDADSVVAMPTRSKIPVRVEACQSKARGDEKKDREEESEWEDEDGPEAFDCSEYELDDCVDEVGNDGSCSD